MASAGEKGGAVSHRHMPVDVRNQWYAISASEDLPKPIAGKVGLKAPNPVGTSILGDPIVLWRDSSGTARCLADKCPHRSAPLSQGKVNGETGNLECIYHGWQFEGDAGTTTCIPALQEGKKIPPNATVRTYPTFEQDNVVYVWPGSVEEAATADKPSQDVMDDGTPLVTAAGFVQQLTVYDLPIDHCLMIENLLDPAHIPFAHEGTIGKRDKAEPLNMTLTATAKGIKGAVKEGVYNAFEAPSTIILHTPPVPGKLDMYQYVGCTPSAPGQTRLVYRSYRNFAKFVDKIPPLKRMFDRFSEKIVFQDYSLLLGQQLRLREHANPWNSSIQVDVLPVIYRNYYKRTFGNHTKDGPWWRGWDGSLDVEDLDRMGAFDRDFDCNGCALPVRPHHPRNVLELSGQPAFPIRPQPESFWKTWTPVATAVLAAAVTAAVMKRT